MESSSNDSFLWTDVSNNSYDSTNNISENFMEMKYKDEPDSSINIKKKLHNKNAENENKSKEIKLTPKKRKCSETTQESSDYSQPENKRIKLEPESDIDNRKKKKIKNDFNIQNSTVYDEKYLNLRVKEEEISMVQNKKKKKKKRCNSNIDTAPQSVSIETNIDTYVGMKVKEEQASLVVPEVVKSKKKKKHKTCTVSSDMDIISEAKSVLTIDESTVQDDSTPLEESTMPCDATEYSIIEEKFFAEETVVEKPRKDKHKKVEVTHQYTNNDKKSVNIKEKSGMTLEKDRDNVNYNDLSRESCDFTGNDIISSTILNTSTIPLRENQVNQTEPLIKKSNVLPSKISDRIRFEEDDNSSQHDYHIGRISAKIDMYMKLNPQFKLCVSDTSKDSLITEDDEIWALSWPHEINIEKLRNTTVSSEGKCKIKTDGQTYEGVLNEDVITITLLTHEPSQTFITNIPIKEYIEYHKRIPKVHIPNNNIMVDNQRNFTPLPETKCRHPLFGAHYKKAIKISTAVMEKLQAAKGRHSEISSKKRKRQEHKKGKHKSTDIKTEQDCVYIKPEHETFNKNRKRKVSQEHNGPPKKLKHVHLHADSPAVWESEKAIEENLFNF